MKRGSSEKSVHLVFGGAMARGLETVRRQFYEQAIPLDEAIEAGKLSLIQYWHEQDFPIETEKSPKSLANCILALDSYFNHFNPHDDYLTPHMYTSNGATRAAVEFSFAIPLIGTSHPTTGEPILYTGRFDMLANSRHSAGFYIVDDKTASQLGSSLAKSMRLRSQFTGYTWACQQLGYEIAGTVVRATQTLKTKIEHTEIIEQRPHHLVDRWHAQLIATIDRMIEMWRNSDFPYALDDACGSYSGCGFQDACARVDPIDTVDRFYDVREWDPLSVVKGD
jgi:hypothetical protein